MPYLLACSVAHSRKPMSINRARTPTTPSPYLVRGAQLRRGSARYVATVVPVSRGILVSFVCSFCVRFALFLTDFAQVPVRTLGCDERFSALLTSELFYMLHTVSRGYGVKRLALTVRSGQPACEAGGFRFLGGLTSSTESCRACPRYRPATRPERRRSP